MQAVVYNVCKLNVKAEEDHVAVFENVIFAFASYFAFFFGGVVVAAFEQRFPIDYFGADEAFFEVRMDFARGLRGFCSVFYRPGAGFLFAGGEIAYKPEQFIRSLYETIESAFGKTELFEEH